MGRGSLSRCPVRPHVDQRSLKNAVGTVFRHLARGTGEDYGDGAWSPPRNYVLGATAGSEKLFVGGGHIYLDLVADDESRRNSMHI